MGQIISQDTAVFLDHSAAAFIGGVKIIPEYPGVIVEFCNPRSKHDNETVRFRFEHGGVVRTTPQHVRVGY